MKRFDIESTSNEVFRVGLISRNDPVGNAPEFQLTPSTVTDPEVLNWVSGEWEGNWNTTSGFVVAVSPVTNSSPGVTLVAGTEMKVWIKWTHGTETPVKVAFLLDVK